MTLSENESSNKQWIESEGTKDIITMIRTAMGEGCIHSALLYDLVDEVLCRLAKYEGISPMGDYRNGIRQETL